MALNVGDIVNFIYLIYNTIKGLVKSLLELTIMRSAPEVAAKFSDAIMFISVITTVWIIMEFTTALKTAVRVVVLLGWILLILSITITLLAP